MKKQIKYLFLLLTVIVFTSCNSETKNPCSKVVKPANVPGWVTEWGTYECKAYHEGRIHYNQDSTIILIEPENPEYHNFDTIDFKEGIMLK